MKKSVKRVAGIDVAQKELVVILGFLFDDFTIEFFAYKVFKNSDTGIKHLVEWINKTKKQETLCKQQAFIIKNSPILMA